MKLDKKKILVAVTGMSPQIITETLFALYRQKSWIPNEVWVLTTSIGKRQIFDNLLGKHGFFHRLCEEYALPDIRFDEDTVQVITDKSNVPLADIRTPEENDWAADQIVRFIYHLCSHEETELHVSIAGGRKSMGFYIGYALSLFGRSQDRLSHVLVEEAFEQHPEFYYPNKDDRFLNTKLGMRNAAEAKVMLADIPFVRMRENLSAPLLKDDWNYLEAVELTQRDLLQFDLEINVAERTICCGGAEFQLAHQDFAIYAAFAHFKKHQPKRCLHLTGRAKQDDMDFAEEVLNFLVKVKPKLRSESAEAKAEVERQLKKFQSDKRIVQEVSSRLKKRFEDKLQGRAALFFIESIGEYNHKSYRLATDENLIRFV
ncbi:MAG: TIGR02584 family CRISPR-associated protein [Neisseria sp.]|jgi:CRISPR-associated protein, NE0113 family|uniref:CRISPR-associated ring nuclease Csm6 n=1 Tax=Neisseria sicca TaxID=490 RepID=UPI0002D3DB47|nr:CRISPR-associated ring nuclease Csm6 [Neisseria sicca]MBS6044224.1 TIGR02584 family CRISPR-associated protein [Neisseria sp.]MDU4437830.1 CRISPR-associated ring nuclease Csm6 [Neisseria sp.]OFJ78419.1 hypothetical protein HMPREF2844_06470 [Neisseria sp. HMSC072F04]